MFAQQGTSGELRAGSFPAARFGSWELERPDDVLASDVAWITVTEVVPIDTFRYEHDSLDIWLDCGAAWWVWRKVLADGARWRTQGGKPEIRVK